MFRQGLVSTGRNDSFPLRSAARTTGSVRIVVKFVSVMSDRLTVSQEAKLHRSTVHASSAAVKSIRVFPSNMIYV